MFRGMYRGSGQGGGSGGDQHNLGWYATPEALRTAHATAEAGDWAIVGSTDTVWIWDTDTNAWKDSDQKGQVASVNGQTGTVVLTASDVGAATTAQGTKADTAVQPADLATVATTGDYDDLTNKPTIPAAQVNSDWNASSGVAQILNKPTLGTAASADTTDFATAAQGALADTAVQPSAIADMETQTHASATYATKSELADKQDIIQYSTMPTASADNVGDIVQFVGTTTASYTNGYFYKCVSDGADPATYSWEEVEVQASSGGGGLPDQTGQSGKFLTTDGTDASWSDKPLQNAATGTYSLTILGNSTNESYGINIGTSSYCGGMGDIVIGYQANSGTSGWYSGIYNIVIGYTAKAKNRPRMGIAIGEGAVVDGVIGTMSGYIGGIAIGYAAQSKAEYAIQLGSYTEQNTINADANTFKVANANGNFEIMSADGTIPEARLADTTNATAGQVLTLDSNLNAVWATGSSGGGVSDVTVNGTSVVSGGVAAITCATIDDTSTSSLTATWSANKLNTTIGDIETLINAL